MTNLPIILYIIFFLAAMFAPLRWSLVGFFLLSNIDLGSLSASIGLLNTAKAVILPVFMLWRFRAYKGHTKISGAPIAWLLLIVYVAIASAWSSFPSYAVKLIGHMIGSFLICMMLMRATKGRFVGPKTILPVTLGTLAIAIVHWFFLHSWGGETERFTTFSGAQSFAAFVTALYCAALCLETIRPSVRFLLCATLAFAVVLNGSRIWIAGLLLATLMAVFASTAKVWIKILCLGTCLTAASILILELNSIIQILAQDARSNRIAAALTAVYEGNSRARSLGTYKFRHEVFSRTIERIQGGSVSEMIFGHGTCNGALIVATEAKQPDPNRAMHNEWLRALYEWGIVGLTLWLWFIGSLFLYAIQGVRREISSYAKPLLIYLPAFALGLTGENIIAGAGNAVSVGLLLLIALASISHRARRPGSLKFHQLWTNEQHLPSHRLPSRTERGVPNFGSLRKMIGALRSSFEHSSSSQLLPAAGR